MNAEHVYDGPPRSEWAAADIVKDGRDAGIEGSGATLHLTSLRSHFLLTSSLLPVSSHTHSCTSLKVHSPLSNIELTPRNDLLTNTSFSCLHYPMTLIALCICTTSSFPPSGASFHAPSSTSPGTSQSSHTMSTFSQPMASLTIVSGQEAVTNCAMSRSTGQLTAIEQHGG